MTNKINLLIVHYGDNWLRGSEVCLINLIESLDDRYVPILWTNNPALVEYAKTNHIRVEETQFPRMLSLQSNERTFDWSQWCVLYNKARILIRKYHINLVHVNSGAPCQWMTMAAHTTKTPLVAQLHSDYNLHDRFTLGLHAVPNIITVSHAISTSLLDEGFDKHRLHVVHNGVPSQDCSEVESINIRQKLGIADSAKIMISIGSLIDRKGFDRLISAAYKLREQDIDCHLVIIGDGENKTLLKQFAQAIDMQDYVHLVGEQSNVPAWLAGGADMFISGARSEAFGLVIVEAALAGLPVIAPATGGIVEIITDRDNGLLYPNTQDAVDHIVQRVSSIIYDPSYGQNIANAGKVNAQRHFSIENNVSHIEAVYENVLLEPKRHRSVFAMFKCTLRPFKTLLTKHIVGRFINRGADYENC
ncbi:glycosyltransferase [Vibrio sp. FNV 38]|nr:glycosyltransferase [Vibrio sp. FNV 38]